jgi:hypothetical protein
MRRRCTILAFCILLAFGVSLAIPAEDVPETAYDESEALPYESTPLFSTAVPAVAARTTQAVPSSLHPGSGTPFPFPSARVRYTNTSRPTSTRISLSLLCTLLC